MIIAWDFDGVLNRNHANGRYVWEDAFEEQVGQPASAFGDFVFRRDPSVIIGQEDMLTRLEAWTRTVPCRLSALEILDLWLELDAHPDAEMLALVDALSAARQRQIVATNNETRRAGFIERQMGMASRVEQVFASGRMGVAKPDPAYFRQITDALGVAASEMFLIDDLAANVEAASAAGWQGYHFTPATRAGLIERLQP